MSEHREEAKGAIYDADRRYQNVDPREQSEDGWADAIEPHLKRMYWERLAGKLEVDVLAGELRHIAERGCVPDGPKDGLAVDVLTWAEAWFLQLQAALGEAHDLMEESK